MQRRLYLRHFPAVGDDAVAVLLIAPNPQRRDTIRRAFEKKDAAYRPDLWRFAAMSELSTETFLHGDIFYSCNDQPPCPLMAAARVSAPRTITRSSEADA